MKNKHGEYLKKGRDKHGDTENTEKHRDEFWKLS